MSEISFYDLLYSVEADKNTNTEQEVNEKTSHQMKTGNSDQKKTLWDNLKELPAKADNISKNFRLWARKSKNLLFYRKYLDRVNGGLYERYSGEARVTENNMVDDPVQILSGEAQKYIQSMVTNINKLYKEVLQISKSLEDKTTAEGAISCVDKYCKSYISETASGSKVNQEKLSWKEKILNATKYKIAKILLSNRSTGVYGYTTKNIVLKGYPKPNHLIVTLFVVNPEEHPQEQSVQDIFKSSQSFDILADANKRDVFNVSAMTTAALSKTINDNVMNEIKLSKNNALAKFKDMELANKKDEGKIIDSIWDGVNASCRELLSRKAYLIECINVYYDMILRIDKLAVKAIKEMLDVEDAHRDKRYDKSVNVGHQNKNLTKNKYSDQYNENASNSSARKEKAHEFKNIEKTLNRSFK